MVWFGMVWFGFVLVIVIVMVMFMVMVNRFYTKFKDGYLFPHHSNT